MNSAAKQPVGIIGLGLLGTALAERLLAAGWAVVGCDRAPARQAALKTLGGEVDTAAGVARRCQTILLVLPNSGIVAEVADEILGELKPSAILLDATTGDPQASAQFGKRFAAHDVRYLDTTVAGSSEQARQRDVVVMMGGPSVALAACRPIVECFAREVFHLGDWGAGARMKLVVNLVLGLNRAALAEGLTLAGALGIDLDVALRVLRSGVAYSRTMDTKGQKMIGRDFEPQARVRQHRKDVGLMLDAAQRANARLPLSELHAELLDRLIAAGYGDADNSAIIEAIEGLAGTMLDERERS